MVMRIFVIIILIIGYLGCSSDVTENTDDVSLPPSSTDTDTDTTWTINLGVSASKITTDNLNNIYVSGTTNTDLDNNTNIGETDYFLIKYDTKGNKLWSKLIGSSKLEISGGSIISDDNSNIYLSGHSRGLIEESSNCNSNLNSSTGNNFLVKFNTFGEKIWSKDLCALNLNGFYRYETSLVTGINNDIIIIGSVNNAEGNFDGYTYIGADDIYVIRFDSSGNKIWSKRIGSAGHDDALSAVSDSNGNIYITGYTGGDLGGETHSGGPSGVWYPDSFLMKLNIIGNTVWTKLKGEYGESERGYYVGIDGNDNIIQQYQNKLLIKYSDSGSQLWSYTLQGNKDFVVDSNNDIILSSGTKISGNDGSFIKNTGINSTRLAIDSNENIITLNGDQLSKHPKQ